MNRRARLGAFLRRDMRIARSYRAAFIGQFIGIAVFLTTFSLMSPLVRDDFEARYGSNYFAFVSVGVAVTGALVGALAAFGGAVRNAQLKGTLEALFTTPAPQQETIVFLGTYSLISGFLGSTVTILGAAVWGVGFHVHPVSLALALVLSVVGFSALGLISSSAVLVFKRGNPVAGLIGLAGTLASGAYVPTSSFPTWLSVIASVNPMRYALDVWRGALVEGASPGSMLGPLAVMAGVAIVAVPVANTVLRRSIDLARGNGSLASY